MSVVLCAVLTSHSDLQAIPSTAAGAEGISKSAPTTKTAVRGKYRDHFNNVFEGFGNFVGGISQDPLNRRYVCYDTSFDSIIDITMQLGY